MAWDDRKETRPGKFEGEPLTTQLLYNMSLNQGADEEFSHPSLGWYALIIINRDDGISDVFRFGSYIIHEADNGFVTSEGFFQVWQAKDRWKVLTEQLAGEGDE